MKRLIPLLLVVFLAACTDEDRDMKKPSITDADIVASPAECDAYRIGDTIHFCYRMTDNVELGQYVIQIHNNHDHHTHSTSATECPLNDVRDPVNPWVYSQDYDIPAGSRDYVATQDIVIPEGIDDGDYHFMIRLTDHSGWQEIKSVAIKIEI